MNTLSLKTLAIASGVTLASVIFSSAITPSPTLAGMQKGGMMSTPTAAKTNTIVDVASGNQSFSTLVTAVKAAGLVETLSGKGPFTVLAPTNEAFNAIPKATLESLLKPENKAKLQKVLTYHVVPGTVLAKDVKAGSVKTVQGSPVTVKVQGGKVMVNNANVTKTDIKASNGVIHVIDKVLLPPNL
ncbi:fasciclin domain-containing protein [Phormidium sp. CLA17]|uniref:fasciclin domain-containing protein n=1 Tax=Leptolyngbya sp. Cla-17 TaxID=2803751 RepID=UPI0014920DEC|nr:fasciclin domain-containing protein [Leptolyngbya sp. Cla-17]MBM0741854.1 fasciclin domain-containing protein [Leptolyngbya sp. Cla-17]